jgi:hypothetical protein
LIVASAYPSTLNRCLSVVDCKGQYSSGYMPARYYLGAEIRKAYTTCAEGAKRLAVTYSVAALPSGELVRFGAIANQSSASPEAAMPRAERVEDAALKTLTAPKR